jgi:hypothetical protein
MYDMSKADAVVKTADMIAAKPAIFGKLLAQYACLGIPFPGVPPESMVVICIHEAENQEQLASTGMAISSAGASIWFVPILEAPAGQASQVLEQLVKNVSA